MSDSSLRPRTRNGSNFAWDNNNDKNNNNKNSKNNLYLNFLKGTVQGKRNKGSAIMVKAQRLGVKGHGSRVKGQGSKSKDKG